VNTSSYTATHTFVSFETDYSQTRWGCGTVLASMAYKEARSKSQLRIAPPHAFYPLGYQDIPKYFAEDDKDLWDALKEDSYALHLFGKVTRKEKVIHGSLVHNALSEFALSNGEFT
jgi:hypothetical protein